MDAELADKLMKAIESDPNFDAYDHVVGRIQTLRRFGVARMNKHVAKHYSFYLAILHEALTDFYFTAPQRITTSAMIDVVGRALVGRVPMRTEISFWNSITGEYSSELEGRRLATQHVLDLILSYRRFEGIKPNFQLDIAQRRAAQSIRVDDLETIAKNLLK